MDVVVSIISLIWVIGILTLQRFDSVTDEFVKAMAYYLAVEKNGSINKDQLYMKSLLPKSAIFSLLQELIKSQERLDKNGLRKGIFFFTISDRIKHIFEFLLIFVTLILPLIQLIDFSKLQFLTFMDKNIFNYLILLLIVIASLAMPKLLLYYSNLYYPIRMKLGDSTQA